jgi:hypothetical protein
VRYELVQFPNYQDLLQNEFGPNFCELPSWLKYYLKKWNIGPSFHGCCATHEGEIVGLVRYTFVKDKVKSKVTLVKKSFRDAGVAHKMWQRILKEHEPKKVLMFAATKAGHKLARSLEDRYNEIDWDIQCTY